MNHTMSDGPTEKRLPRDEARAQAGCPEGYQPVYDEAALDRFAEKGAIAWADVPDAVKWVRETRGAADDE